MSYTRRAHSKSRNGCEDCKRRKVKCDESVPCSQCIKRDTICSLVLTSSSPAPASEPQVESFEISDFALFHHFTTNTARVLANDPVETSPWISYIPGLATKHPFLLHEVLAIAAAHLSHLQPEQAARYLRIAGEHQAQSLKLFRPALAGSAEEMAAPLFACSCLFVSYYFAVCKEPVSLIFNTETPGPPEWMLTLRGCSDIFLHYKQPLTAGPIGEFMDDYLKIPEPDEPGSSDVHLTQLKNRLKMPPLKQNTLLQALEQLRVCFAISDRGDPLSCKMAALQFPSMISPSFLDMLGEKSPHALVIMAYWCVLLRRVDGRWWFYKSDRASEILSAVKEYLPAAFRGLISWPLEVVEGDKATGTHEALALEIENTRTN